MAKLKVGDKVTIKSEDPMVYFKEGETVTIKRVDNTHNDGMNYFCVNDEGMPQWVNNEQVE